MAESGATGAASSSLSLEDLVKAFKTFSQLANEDLVAQFTRILQDHEELQIKNARLRTAHEVDCESIAHLRAEVAKDEDLLKVQEEKRKALKKDLAAAHAEIRSAKKELEEKTARATELRNGLDTRDREIKDLNRAVDQERTAAQKARSAQQQAAKRIVALEDDLAKTQRFLQDARDELDRMRSMGLTLTKQPRETSAQSIRGIFDAAWRLAQAYFYADFDEALLRQSARAGIILHQGRDLPSPSFPLPASNTTVAKQMRVSAALAVVAFTLLRYIVRPVYLRSAAAAVGGGGGGSGRDSLSSSGGGAGGRDQPVCDLLSSLAAREPQKEAHLRAVLLAAVPADEQAAVARERAALATDAVCDHLENLLVCARGSGENEPPGASRPASAAAFKMAVRRFFDDVLDRWKVLQKLEEKIEGSTRFDDDEEEGDDDDDEDEHADWALLPFDATSSPTTTAAASNPEAANGSARPPSPPHSASLYPDALEVHVVWPRFFVREPRGWTPSSRLLAPGFFLADETVREAREEIQRAAVPPHQAARFRRTVQRARTMSVGGLPGLLQPQKPPQQPPFLSTAVGGGG